MDEMVRLGISWMWLGLEGEDAGYAKLNKIRTLELVPRLQDHGIRVLGSSIIGLQSHTPDNIDTVIDYAVRHNTDFHQFMLYTPLSGTPLYDEHRRGGTLLDDVDPADIHGQFRFNFQHPAITSEQSEEFLLRAFRADFDVNGPSVFRVVRTLLKGWHNMAAHPEARVRERFARETQVLKRFASGALWAVEGYFRDSNRRVAERVQQLRDQLTREFGTFNRLMGPALGRVILAALHREARRLRDGFVLEPRTFVERRNWRAEHS